MTTENGQSFETSSGFSKKALRIVEIARDEALKLNHHHLQPKHLLLGLIKDPDVEHALKEVGVEPLIIHDAVITMFNISISPGDRILSRDTSIHATHEVGQVLSVATEEAKKRGTLEINHTDLLTGIIWQTNSTWRSHTSDILASVGLGTYTPDQFRRLKKLYEILNEPKQT